MKEGGGARGREGGRRKRSEQSVRDRGEERGGTGRRDRRDRKRSRREVGEVKEGSRRFGRNSEARNEEIKKTFKRKNKW